MFSDVLYPLHRIVAKTRQIAVHVSIYMNVGATRGASPYFSAHYIHIIWRPNHHVIEERKTIYHYFLTWTKNIWINKTDAAFKSIDIAFRYYVFINRLNSKILEIENNFTKRCFSEMLHNLKKPHSINLKRDICNLNDFSLIRD